LAYYFLICLFMSSFFHKWILSILVSVFLLSSIVYAANTIIYVQPQSIWNGDTIAVWWYQDVNDSVFSQRNTIATITGTLNTLSWQVSSMSWQLNGSVSSQWSNYPNNTTPTGIYYPIGNVGIWVMPIFWYKLVVNGDIATKISTNESTAITIWNSTRNWNLYNLSWTDSSSPNAFLIENCPLPWWCTRALTITKDNNIWIWITTPWAKLDINGQVKITDGTQWVGKVLTSDANGFANWTSPLDWIMNNSSQNSWVLPQSAGSTVVTAWGSYDYGSFSVTPWVYMWFVYNCAGQLSYSAGEHWNSLSIVWPSVIYSSSTWSDLNNTPYNTCWIFYTWVVKINTVGVVKLRIDSYHNSVLITPWPTANSFNTTLVKVF